ncbi:hypothetical protein GQ44DRAFT_655078 [Phaeosphaeriaceae sp. PMI808]|nr:hypothetical protein GQ44DRAFT_655078 [Phaeosphaeriaceae sp. PMI808]
MGTLTADCPRLDVHCPHKLATSCRLTSTPNCCACADERAHSRTYRVYIDGIGFVQRGTRWQGYCWFCKEFWTNRLAATDPPVEISQTRIPEIPDQSEFLERWFEFHQGYRIAKLQDGVEQRMPVMGEPFKEVSPGFLPRTLDQLRAGVVNDALRPENRHRHQPLPLEEEQPAEPQPSLESALDNLLAEASDDEIPRPSQEPVPQPTQVTEAPRPARRLPPRLPPRLSPRPPLPPLPASQPRPLNNGEARLQRARERFARVFGTREDIQQEDYESPLSTMYNRADDRYRQAEERRANHTTAPPSLEGLSARERREIDDQLLWGVMRESATALGLESEGDVWSYAPRRIPGERRSRRPDHFDMFVNAHSRVRARQNLTPTPPLDPSLTGGVPGQSRTAAPIDPAVADFIEQHVEPGASADHVRWFARQLQESSGAMAAESTEASAPSSSSNSNGNDNGMSQIQTSIQQITSELQRLRLASEAITTARHSMNARFTHGEHPSHSQTLDNQPDRPPPMTSEEMTKSLECQVCYQQLANIAVLPCGHMVMCQWCADVVVPVKHSHLPVMPTKCPMCRKVVKQRFKIHM